MRVSGFKLLRGITFYFGLNQLLISVTVSILQQRTAELTRTLLKRLQLKFKTYLTICLLGVQSVFHQLFHPCSVANHRMLRQFYMCSVWSHDFQCSERVKSLVDDKLHAPGPPKNKHCNLISVIFTIFATTFYILTNVFCPNLRLLLTCVTHDRIQPALQKNADIQPANKSF